ncbi:MAG: hypothetical protein WBG73_05985 [Coleofasciculaceae cyanobacterium]
MALDVGRFYQACSPSPLVMGNTEDRKYYIDFSSVRGGNIIKELGRTIALRKHIRTIIESGIYTISHTLKFLRPSSG